MSFTPKFVDLVRNSTSVQGTGPVVLGAPPAGFTGFAEALSAGDQFYYCIRGTDKPAEREVGKGTLLADGTIGREALNGAPTKFTGGAKTISLVAPAEWYQRIDVASAKPAGIVPVATRALLAAETGTAGAMRALAEDGREGLFKYVAANLSAKVAADTAQGLFVAPASDPSGAAGAWVRQYDGRIDFRWFGAVPDDATDCLPAFNAARRALTAIGQVGPENWMAALPSLFIPASGRFYSSGTWDVWGQLAIEGEGCGQAGSRASVVRFAPGQTGIRIQRANTSGARGNSGGTGKAGDGSTVRGLTLQGAFAGTEAEAHGIQLRARATIERCTIVNFEGDGVHIVATAGAADGAEPPEGNANGWRVDDVTATGCRNGLYLRGADVNAGASSACDFSSNRWCGLFDDSFLGNAHIGLHAAACGDRSTFVNHAGQMYACVAGQEGWAAANPPSGTTADNQGWYWFATYVSPFADAWTSGRSYRAGGPYRTGNAPVVLLGCYSESGEGPAQLGHQTEWKSGMNGAGNRGGIYTGGSQNHLMAMGGIRSRDEGANLDVRLGGGAANGDILNISHPLLGEPRLCFVPGYGVVLKTVGYGMADRSYLWQTSAVNGLCDFGRSSKPLNMHCYRELAIGDGTFDFNQARVIQVAAAAPTGGDHARGEIVFNRDPVAGGPMGWMCVAGGSPGTWKAMPSLAA